MPFSERSSCSQPFSNTSKWYSSLISGLLFALLTSSFFYSITNSVTKSVGLTVANQGCPNLAGLFLHAILFMIFMRMLLQIENISNCRSNKDKWIVSVMGGTLFLVVASPFLYDVSNTISNSMGIVISNNGCPNSAGILVHALIFTLIVRLLMR